MLGEIKTACHPKQVERLLGWLEPGSPLIGDNQAINRRQSSHQQHFDAWMSNGSRIQCWP
jgi:hypothetical protein